MKLKGYFKKKEITKPQEASLGTIIGVVQEFKDIKEDIINVVDIELEKIDVKVKDVEEFIEAKSTQVDTALDIITENVKETTEQLIQETKEIIKNIEPEKGDPGTPADENKIVEDVLSKIPKLDEGKLLDTFLKKVPKLNEQSLLNKFLKQIPDKKGDLKIIQEKVEIDPMSVIEKIMEMPPGKFTLKTSNIDGLEQTMSAFRSQLGRGYLHGGGDTVVAGANITITSNANGTKTIASTAGGASPLTTKGDIYTFTTVDARLPVGTNGQVLSADSTETTGLKWIAAPATGLTIGTTTITSGTTTRILYNNAGVLGEYTLTGTGTVVAMQTAPTFATSITGSYLTASQILITDASKNIVSAAVATYPSLTELTYLKGVTSAIQTQLDAKVSFAWGASISGTTADGVTLNLSNSADASASALKLVAGNTQTNNTALVNLQIGTSTRPMGLLIQGTGSTTTGALGTGRNHLSVWQNINNGSNNLWTGANGAAFNKTSVIDADGGFTFKHSGENFTAGFFFENNMNFGNGGSLIAFVNTVASTSPQNGQLIGTGQASTHITSSAATYSTQGMHDGLAWQFIIGNASTTKYTTARTTDYFGLSHVRLHGNNSVTDDYKMANFVRDNRKDGTGITLAQGSVATMENLYTQTSGTLTDSVDILQLLQNSSSTGLLINAKTGGTAVFTVDKTGNVTVDGNIIANGATSVVRLQGYTVAGLPAGTQGDTAYVTDALAPAFLVAVAGGGAVITTVFHNGTTWVAQ